MTDFITAISNAGLTPPATVEGDGKLHRFAGNGDARKKNSWYVYYDDGDLPGGAFGDWKTGISETWCSKSTRSLSVEEKTRHRQNMEAALRIREAETATVQSECRKKSAELWNIGRDVAEDHPYIVRKQIIPVGIRQLNDLLMVPVLDRSGVVHGLQFISPDGTKKFKTGTYKQGHFSLIGKPNGTVIICEGYATGVSLHHATGHAVFVAFDAGNLLHVAQVYRKAKPDAVIIIAADNDCWGEKNTGLDAAVKTVKAVNGKLAYPVFPDATDDRPTDFNDLACLYGMDHVREVIESALLAEPEPEPEPPPEEYHHDEPEPGEESTTTDMPFICLGYDQGSYYYLPHGSQQIVSLSASQHQKHNLMTLAPLNYWKRTFSGDNDKIAWDAVANSLIQLQQISGVYDAGRLRGRGAWWDHGKIVCHMGGNLRVDGKPTPLRGYQSQRFIYEKALDLDAVYADGSILATEQSSRLLDLCSLLSWQNPLSAYFLAGWSVIAPICGAMLWRPHVWITGGSGTGKSWIVDNIVKPVTGGAALYVLGSSTEAGLRQSLRADARPVIFDEAESENHHSQQRMQSVLELARQSSSEGAEIVKGTTSGKASQFRIRSAFCFSSIGVGISQQADASRITTLNLIQQGTQNDRETQFREIQRIRSEIITPQYCQQLRARSMSLIPIIRENSHTFATVAARILGGQRQGDQAGVLLAGAYSLRSVGLATPEAAAEFLERFELSNNRMHTDQRDEFRCLNVILEARIKINSRSPAELSIGEAVMIALGIEAPSPGIDIADAEDGLRRNGIRTDGVDFFYIANSHSDIKRILKDTPWAQNWALILSRLPGAKNVDVLRFKSTTSRATAISADAI